ncbi:MAG: hypothetical protein KC442_13195 [Thermomicrobiales bacterium]|nr:hypothetical protein [Thermomicrobiales bacterium]
MIILLDSGPVGLLTYTGTKSSLSNECIGWFQAQSAAGAQFVLPGIVDYEIRRELMRIRKASAIRRLDWLPTIAKLMPVDTDILALAAQLWAMARQAGAPTADDKHLDIDVILAAHARITAERNVGEQVVVATTNVRHLNRFVDARHWGF